MVNWHDPVLILRDSLALLKLDYALAGIYIWEMVFTMGFELDILWGKRPYRWTIWLYLGTRYFGLATFIVFFIDTDGGNVPCHPLVIANHALPYISWAFASSIIVLRVMAIWRRNIIMSSIAVVAWMAGLALNIRNLTMIVPSRDPITEGCAALKTHRGLANAIAVLAVDVTLLIGMLIGLLRSAHKSSTGIWYLLYQQCIIWIFLAGVAEIPPVVFLALNFNDPWNEMFTGLELTILTIGAARMYRSLTKQGSFTDYSSDPPHFSPGLPVINLHRDAYTDSSPMHFATVGTSSRSERTMAEAPVFIPADQTRIEFIPGASATTLSVPAISHSKESITIQTAHVRP